MPLLYRCWDKIGQIIRVQTVKMHRTPIFVHQIARTPPLAFSFRFDFEGWGVTNGAVDVVDPGDGEAAFLVT